MQVKSISFDHNGMSLEDLAEYKQQLLNEQFQSLESQGYEILNVTETTVGTISSVSGSDSYGEYDYTNHHTGTIVMIYYKPIVALVRKGSKAVYKS